MARSRDAAISRNLSTKPIVMNSTLNRDRPQQGARLFATNPLRNIARGEKRIVRFKPDWLSIRVGKVHGYLPKSWVRRILVCLLAILPACLWAESHPRPNVILIYGDDVGFADVGVNGATRIPTPHIDTLARSGLNFTDGHATASTCTPSRYSLLTGIHAFRDKVAIAPPDAALLMNPEDVTLARVFKRAGYATGIVGKWHLGLGEEPTGPDWNGILAPGPLELGFDEAFIMPTTNDRVPCVYVEGHRVVGLDPNDPLQVGSEWDAVNTPGSTQYPDARKMGHPEPFYQSVINGIGRIGYMAGGKSALWDDYTMADVFVERARKFIAERQGGPFFLYFASQDIHIPNAPHERFQGKTDLGPRGDAMVQLDFAVGAIMAEVAKHDLTRDTIVIFTSDNGPTHHDDDIPYTPEVARYSPPSGDGHDASGRWRGGKYEIYEGGNRVPWMVSWPARIKPGTSEALVSQIDLLASFSSLLGVPLGPRDAPDSRDTLAAFLGEDPEGLPFILEEARTVALREGSWKYIPGADSGHAAGFGPPRDSLYDLATDPGERTNLIDQYPRKAREMAKQLRKLKKSAGIALPRASDSDI